MTSKGLPNPLIAPLGTVNCMRLTGDFKSYNKTVLI